jgi:hypothetical protein
MAWTLADIRRTLRQVSGRLSSNQLTNADADMYINNYYRYEFPAEVKLEKQLTFYEFNTAPLQIDYDFDTVNYTNIEPPVYVDLDPILYYQDPVVYYGQNPEQITKATPWSGDGMTVGFNTTVTVPYIVPGTVIITDNVETFTDDGNGVLTGDQGGNGTVNYVTGAIVISFSVAPASGDNIYLSYEQMQPGKPSAVLFYDNIFRFYTIPDTVYRIRVKAFKVPDALVNGTDTPPLQEWGPCIAYGAARRLFLDFGEMDQYTFITPMYKEQVSYILARTVNNLTNTRAQPNF